MASLEINVGEPNWIKFSTATTVATSTVNNSLTLSMALKKQNTAEDAVTNGTGTLSSLDSSGNYGGYPPYNMSIVKGDRYWLYITDASNNVRRRIDCVAIDHHTDP